MAYSRDLENTDRKVEKPGRVRKQITEVHCRAIATAGDETLFPGRKILENGIHYQIKVMVPVHILIPQCGNMLPYMMNFIYVIKNLGKERLS